MCKIGDILLIYNARNNKKPVGMHPFLVLNDEAGIVSGIYSYEFIGLLLTSADTQEKKERLKKIEGNFPIAEDDKIIDSEKHSNNKYSYVEADQFFYFDKNKINYIKIGRLEPEIYILLIEFIESLMSRGITIKQIFDKATKININDKDS